MLNYSADYPFLQILKTIPKVSDINTLRHNFLFSLKLFNNTQTEQSEIILYRIGSI